jgi:hypothetical protein
MAVATPSTIETPARDVSSRRNDTGSGTGTAGESPPSLTLARVTGALFITATVASVISSILVNPVVDSGRLATIAAHQDQMIAGASFQLLAAFSSAAIGLMLYPVLKRHADALAIGSAGFRLIEGTLYAVAAIAVLLLLNLGQEYARAGAHPSAYFQTTGALLRTLRSDAALAGILAFYIGGGMYYSVFYRANLLPRWLAGWGLIGVTLGGVAGLCVLFQVITLGSAVHTALNIPIGVQEMVFAIWLIVNGFSPASRRAPIKPDEPSRRPRAHA